MTDDALAAGVARRDLLKGLAAGLPMVAAAISPAWAATPAPARPAAADLPRKDAVPLSDRRLLEAFVRLRGSADGSITAGWLDSQRYAVVDGEAYPLCRVLAGALSRFERKSETLFEATILEVTHYVDLETGALLDTIRMPVSGRLVKVPPYRFGPVPVRFGVRHDEQESFSPKKEGKGSENFAPQGTVRLQRSISDPHLSGEQLFVRHEEHGSLTPASSDVRPVSYREWTIWRGPAAVALDPLAAWCPCENSYTAMTSWRPWMQMDDHPGNTLDTGRGGKARRFLDLPQDYLALTERVHPDVIRDPEAALLGKR